MLQQVRSLAPSNRAAGAALQPSLGDCASHDTRGFHIVTPEIGIDGLGAPKYPSSDQPNDLWCADYKGEFMLADRQYCDPLTITDFASTSERN